MSPVEASVPTHLQFEITNRTFKSWTLFIDFKCKTVSQTKFTSTSREAGLAKGIWRSRACCKRFCMSFRKLMLVVAASEVKTYGNLEVGAILDILKAALLLLLLPPKPNPCCQGRSEEKPSYSKLRLTLYSPFNSHMPREFCSYLTGLLLLMSHVNHLKLHSFKHVKAWLCKHTSLWRAKKCNVWISNWKG